MPPKPYDILGSSEACKPVQKQCPRRQVARHVRAKASGRGGIHCGGCQCGGCQCPCEPQCLVPEPKVIRRVRKRPPDVYLHTCSAQNALKIYPQSTLPPLLLLYYSGGWRGLAVRGFLQSCAGHAPGKVREARLRAVPFPRDDLSEHGAAEVSRTRTP